MGLTYRDTGTYRSTAPYSGFVLTALNYDGSFSYDLAELYDEGAVEAFTFTPPSVLDVPPYLPDSTPRQKALFRHYQSRSRGVNVFWLSDMTFVQDTPTQENHKTNIPYPWDPSYPGGPYSTTYNIDGSVTTLENDPYILTVFYGGTSVFVDLSLYNLLVSAGYGDCLAVAG